MIFFIKKKVLGQKQKYMMCVCEYRGEELAWKFTVQFLMNKINRN